MKFLVVQAFLIIFRVEKVIFLINNKYNLGKKIIKKLILKFSIKKYNNLTIFKKKQ